MKDQLLASDSFEITDTQTEEDNFFITRYNKVIAAYNRYASETNTQKLLTLTTNSYIIKLNRWLHRPVLILLAALVIFFIPIINIACLSGIFVYLFFMLKTDKFHRQNLKLVSDPFLDFYFMPEFCHRINKHYLITNLEQQEINGFTFNQQINQTTINQLKAKHNGKALVLIYDQYLYDSFYLFRKQLFKTIFWTAMAIILMAGSTFFYFKMMSWM